MKVGPNPAIVRVSRSARRACASPETRRGPPNRIQRLRSRTNASTKGVSRTRMTRPRRQRFMCESRIVDRGSPKRLQFCTASPGNQSLKDCFLASPHLAALTPTAFRMVMTQNVQRPVYSQPLQFLPEGNAQFRGLAASLLHTDVDVSHWRFIPLVELKRDHVGWTLLPEVPLVEPHNVRVIDQSN